MKYNLHTKNKIEMENDKSIFLTGSFITTFSLMLLSAFALLSCNGCRSGKVNDLTNTVSPNTVSDTGHKVTEVGTTSPSSVIENPTDTYKQPEVRIQRNYAGKEIELVLNPEHIGGEAWTVVWEEDITDESFERKNRIVQLSPTVMLYRRFPKEVAKNFYYIDQPDKIEFLDTSHKTIKMVDIWKERPYQKFVDAKLTYWHFDSEGMGVISYTEQKTPVRPNEYSLFTDVRSEGNHVIVNYELRSIKNVKNFGVEGYSSDVVAVKHTIHIYDLKGNLKYVLKDLPSVDGAVVSNDGRYMMYIFGGMGLATANSPFGTIERPGWALMRLEDRKVVYQEYTDDGILAFNRLSIQQNMPVVGFSTPRTNDGVYDYFVFYDDKNESIYKKLWTHEEWKMLDEEYKNTGNMDWKYYIKKFNFEQIKIEEK